MKAILNFDSETCENIFSCKQKYIIRNQNFRQNVDAILVYETYGEGQVIGEFYIKSFEKYDMKTIWGLTKHANGMTEKQFNKYLGYRGFGYFIEIGLAVRYIDTQHISAYSDQTYMRHNCLYID